MERDRTGWDRKIGREGGKRICMDGQAFWEWESPGFLLVFRSLSPIILWVCSSSFFQQFKNSPSFDLCYYTALFFFLARRASSFSALLLPRSTFTTLTTISLLRLSLHLNLLLGLPSVFLSLSVTITIQPSREKMGWEDSNNYYRDWLGWWSGKRSDSYACTRVRAREDLCM